MSTMRSLSELKLAVARIEHQSSNLGLRQISEFPLADEHTKKYQFPLHCDLSGIYIGHISTINVAGHSPFLGQWKQTQARHPVFSLPVGARLKLARESYLRFCAFSAEEIANEQLTSNQEELLRVLALAMLHDLTDVRQDCKWLPSFASVVSNWKSLISLSYWKLYLDSPRFKFPSFRIWRETADGDWCGYLQACWERKKDYEKNVSAAITEEEHRRAVEAERIMLRIRDDVVGKRPMSPKLLWRWFEQNMPSRYKKDISTWMSEIFFASEKSIHDNTIRDVELFAEMAAAELPLGSTISHAFFAVLDSKRELLSNYYQGYAILDDDWDSEDGTNASGAAELLEQQEPAGPEPRREDFGSVALFLVAKARWHLASKERTKFRQEALAKQQVASVKPTFIPDLPWKDDEDEDELDATQQFINNNRDYDQDAA